MNTKQLKQFFFVSSFSGILLLLGVRSAYAESLQATPQQTESTNTTELTSNTPVLEAEATLTPEATSETTISTAERFDPGNTSDFSTLESVTTPIPGTVKTSAASLKAETLTAQTTAPTTEEAPATTAPTAPTVRPGRATRSGPSYVAVGGNIGFGGNTALGRGNFVITSKIGLTRYLSARPGLVIGRSPTILLPVTFDFPIESVAENRVRFAPFVGGGLAVSTRGNSAVRALVTGGIDIPITDRFTAVASANVAFFNRPEIGVILGVGYNF